MIILSKKPIELRAPDGQKMIVRPHDLANVPDKFTTDPMFGWCVSDGTFTVAGKSKSAKETVAVPTIAPAQGASTPLAPAPVPEKPAPDASTTVPNAAPSTSYTDMGFKELRAIAKERGIAVPVGTSKETLLEMLK